MTRPPGISGEEWLSMIREVRDRLAQEGIECDPFMVNRILMSLLKAYDRSVADDPALAEAVMDGDIEIVPG